MKIGIPTEIKILEGRVALIPAAVADLVEQGHQVFVQTQAGSKSGYHDEAYVTAGAEIVPSAESLYASTELIVKVKEPQAEELAFYRKDHTLFSYLHLAAEPELTKSLLEIGLTAIGFETVMLDKQLPLLAPMSDIAGRIAVQVGSHLLHQPQGGEGILLGGVAGTMRGNVAILGGGTAGFAACQLASAIGANVTVFDPNRDKHEKLLMIGQNVTTHYPYANEIEQAVQKADLLIGAVLIPGARAPYLVSAAQVATMKQGSVIIDISVDQGGCIETTRPTSYAEPTFEVDGVIHFGVTNMPGAVPRTASEALSSVLLPYVSRLAASTTIEDEILMQAINVRDHEICLDVLKP